MEFWSDWIAWWTGVSSQWNAIDAKIQAGEVTLSESQQAQYEAYKEIFNELDRAIGEVTAEDVAELKLVASGDEIAASVLQGTTKLVESALGWVDSLF